MRHYRYLAIAAILGASILWGAYGRSPAVAQGQVPNRAQQWEYRSAFGNPTSSQEYNKLGTEGWELCGVVSGQTVHDTIAIFKRPKP